MSGEWEQAAKGEGLGWVEVKAHTSSLGLPHAGESVD